MLYAFESDEPFNRSYSSRFITFTLMLFFVPLTTAAQVIDIELSKIQELSKENSYQWEQFENRLDYAITGEQSALTRLNPSIAYDLEFLDDGRQSEYEHALYLQKEFRTPGHFRSLRDRRDS